MYLLNKHVVWLLLLGLIISSCSDNGTSSFLDEPPELPPASSMEMDFSTFENQQKSQGQMIQVDSMDHFLNAAVRAGLVKIVVELNLVVPRALLQAAHNSEAELNENEEWVWRFTRTVSGLTYGVRLVAARGDGDQVDWSFYVTHSQEGIDDELLFSGTTSSDGQEGTWNYYDPSDGTSSVVSDVTWSIDEDDNVELLLEVLSNRNSNLGDYIKYTFDGTVKIVVYHDADVGETTELQWNVETHEGHIISPGYIGGVRGCWDSNLINTPCS